jgi:hypothetical protein
MTNFEVLGLVAVVAVVGIVAVVAIALKGWLKLTWGKRTLEEGGDSANKH